MGHQTRFFAVRACRGTALRMANCCSCGRRWRKFYASNHGLPLKIGGHDTGFPRFSRFDRKPVTCPPISVPRFQFRDICARRGEINPWQQESLARLLHKLPGGAGLRRRAAAAGHVGAQSALGHRRRLPAAGTGETEKEHGGTAVVAKRRRPPHRAGRAEEQRAAKRARAVRGQSPWQ